VGSLNAYHVTPYRHTFSIFGTKSNLYELNLCFDEGARLTRQTTRLDGKKEPEVPVEIEGTRDRCGNLRKWHRAIVEGGEPYPSLADGARAVAAVFAAEESARSGRIVDVPKIEP
jgi:predicted dehydrogenase